MDSPTSTAVTNGLTVDVEDYFQVSAFAPHIARERWDSMPCRVERNVDRLLDQFAARQVHGTFFTLGWIAQRYPALIRRITDVGHELASHGFSHQRAFEQSPAEFFEDLTRSKQVLEDIAGVPVLGYRAPSFSIGESNPWAFECLLRAGYRYSSSVYPVKHDHYGFPDSPRFPYSTASGLLEIPITTTRVWGRNLPAGGGGYFRLAPYALSRWAIKRVNVMEQKPAVFYTHPWEFDPDQPRVPGISAKTRFRHYVNIGRTSARLDRLLVDFRWDRMDRVFAIHGRTDRAN